MAKSVAPNARTRSGGIGSTFAIGMLAGTFLLASCVTGAASSTGQAGGRSPQAIAGTGTDASVPAVVSADWPVYHLNAERTGNSSSFAPFGALSTGWSAALDGAVYAEPLVVNGSIIAATEHDSVYALNLANGAVLWHQSLGTPVPLSALPCGDIDPLGITGTPAFDPITGSLFAVAEVAGPQHVLFALNPATGAVLWSRNVDLPGDDPTTHQQRPALAVANGYVYIGFGGLAGDCGQYVGEVVGVPASGSGATISYRVPTAREGAVWATGGPVIDPSGNLYVSVGNGASTTTYDGTDSVLELSPTLSLLSRFAPSTWATDNANDADLGSLSPTLVSGGWVFIAGKSGTGYVLQQGALGNIGGQVSSATVCTGFGATAVNGATVYVPCVGSLRQVQVAANGSLTLGWQTTAAGGPPVIGGGAVWSVNTSKGQLVALDQATGAILGSIAVGAVPHFVSPTLWGSQILVGTNGGVTSVNEASGPAPLAAYHPLTPTRILDTRNGTGGLGILHSHVAQGFTVWGNGGVPSGAVAVTGNLTVTQQSSLGFLYVGPAPANDPTSSNLNFPTRDDRANGVTVALAGDGKLYVTFAAPVRATPTAHVIFDVTGYFTAGTGGDTYTTVAPARILDSRVGTGGLGIFHSHEAQGFLVRGRGGVPAGAVAVTGNLTVTQQSSLGFLYAGPGPVNDPTSSTLNFPAGDDRANGVTVTLSSDGMMYVTYAAPLSDTPTAHVIFDVTGYFTADLSGAMYHTLNPTRILDSRNGTGGISGAIGVHTAHTFQVTGGVVPAGADAVTGNLTVTGQTSKGYLFIGPAPLDFPTTSTLNFPVSDDRANGVTVALGATGTLSVTMVAPLSGNSAQVIFDVTGYFVPAG